MFLKTLQLPLKYSNFLLCSLSVAPDWNFKTMAISLPIKPPLCPKKSDNRPNGEQLILNTINNTLFCRLSLATNKEFNYSSHGRHFVCKLSLVLRRKFASERCCLPYLLVYQIGKRHFGYSIV